MHGTIMCAAMLEEWRIRGDRSIVAYAYKIAVEYGLDKVSVRQAYKKLVKRVIKQTNDLKLLTNCFNYRSLVTWPYINVKDHIGCHCTYIYYLYHIKMSGFLVRYCISVCIY